MHRTESRSKATIRVKADISPPPHNVRKGSISGNAQKVQMISGLPR